jgi:hypothetical protein
MSLAPGQVLRSDHLNQILRALREATSVVSGLSVEPTSPASMNVVVRAGTAVINGAVVTLASDTTVAISTPDPTYPRFDLVTLKSTGAVGYYVGTPEAAVAVDLAKPETYVKPKPPSTPLGEVALAEVFVPAGATAIDKIIDRRIITTMAGFQTITLQGLTADPTLAAGKIWFRSDLSKILFSPDGVTAKTFGISTFSELYFDEIPDAAKALSAEEIGAAVRRCLAIDSHYVAAVFNDTNLSASKATAILNDSMMPASKLVAILNSPNITASRISLILTDTSVSADAAQSILYKWIDGEVDYDKLLQVLTYGAPDYSVTASTTLTTGVNRYGTLSISSGVTLTLGASPGVIIADTVSNSGTIVSGWVCGAGGAPGKSGAGAGGGGCGALIILARSMTVGTITANGVAGGSGSTVAATAGGGAGSGGSFWLISGDSVPSGGNGGGALGGLGKPNGGGGGGGPGANIFGGNGGVATTTTFVDGVSLLKEILKTVVDWWLVNVAGKTPTTTKSIPSLGGSGGGGGAAYDAYSASGGGGGGAGQIIVYGTSITAGSVQAVGGAGGAGGAEGSYDYGGGGGGGGIIYVFYKSLTGSFTYNVSGGAGGTGDGAGTAGGTGVFKAIAV